MKLHRFALEVKMILTYQSQCGLVDAAETKCSCRQMLLS